MASSLEVSPISWIWQPVTGIVERATGQLSQELVGGIETSCRL